MFLKTLADLDLEEVHVTFMRETPDIISIRH